MAGRQAAASAAAGGECGKPHHSVCDLYEQESECRWSRPRMGGDVAPLSRTPGQLSPERTDDLMNSLVQRDNLTVFISPAHPNVEQMRKKAQSEPLSAITDDSFWYLG